MGFNRIHILHELHFRNEKKKNLNSIFEIRTQYWNESGEEKKWWIQITSLFSVGILKIEAENNKKCISNLGVRF